MPIGLAAGAISGIVGGIGQVVAGERQNKAQRELAEYSYNKDLEMWHKGNEYNNPSSQMERLKAAGLNPNLVYGSGQTQGNSASQLPKYSAPKMDYSQQGAGIAHAANTIGQYMSMKKLGAEINYIDANTVAQNTRTNVMAKQAQKLGIDISDLKFTQPARRATAYAENEYKNMQIAQVRNQVLNTIKDRELKTKTSALLDEKISWEQYMNSVQEMNIGENGQAIIRMLSMIFGLK